MIDVHATVEISQREGGFFIHIRCFNHLLSKKIEDRNCEPFLVAFFEVKSDVRVGRVRIKT